MNVRSEFSYSRAKTCANDEVPRKKLRISSDLMVDGKVTCLKPGSGAKEQNVDGWTWLSDVPDIIVLKT